MAPSGMSWKGSEKRKRGFVTFLAGAGDYVEGVIALAKGLRKVRSSYPLLVAVLDDVPLDHQRKLRRHGCLVRQIEPIHPPESQVKFANPYYVINYSKLQLWQFDDYSKLVYLDADTQVYSNIDELLELPDDGSLYACLDCFCEKSWKHSVQHQIGYCQQSPEKREWPSELGEPPSLYFNAGVFVFEPSILTFDALMQTLMVTPPSPFAEQDFLNMFFNSVYKPLPQEYNLVLPLLWHHRENVDIDKAKVVHYCSPGSESKPWRYTGRGENMDRAEVKILVERWWTVYRTEFDASHCDDKLETGLLRSGSGSYSEMSPAKSKSIPAPAAA